MDSFPRHGSWAQTSLSITGSRKAAPLGLTLAAQVASLTPVAQEPDSDSGPAQTPELKPLLGKSTDIFDTIDIDAQDSPGIPAYNCQDDLRNSNRVPSTSKVPSLPPLPPSISSAHTTPRSQSRIRSLRPLDIAALRDHTLSPRDSLLLSSSYGRWPDALSVLGDTPHSWATASYVSALPQTPSEVADMDIDDVKRLAEDAGMLQQRATTALRLAQQRLQADGSDATNQLVAGDGAISAIAQIVLHLYIILLILVMMLLEGGMRVIGRARNRDVARVQRGFYSAMGAVAGLANGVGSFAQRKQLPIENESS